VSPTGAKSWRFDYPTLTIKNAEVAHYSAKSMPAEVPPRNPALAKPARILAPYLSARLRRIESSPHRDFKQPIYRPTFNNVISRVGYEGRFSPHSVRGTTATILAVFSSVRSATVLRRDLVRRHT
jgi:hypothetical protein